MAKRLTKIITMGVLIIMALGLFTACGDKDWSKDFDLSDEKIVWDESTYVDDEHTTLDKLIVKFKSTDTYPCLELRDFKMSNAKGFVYTNLNPSEGELYYDGWRQSGEITLKKTDKQSIIAAIRHLETLPFVKSVQQMQNIPVDNSVMVD
ncbi:MAG: hypothetical protein EOM23_08185 [Candidatus Moranbacteria bacterium]|jgi:hypothetical protein|nr:hypothetical protein [Candidatus Moranbacteria bacterium]NLF42065.1 hypothetical protein [Bacteroidales bacterium]